MLRRVRKVVSIIGESLLELFIRLSVVGDKDISKTFQRLEREGEATERSLSNIGDGTDKAAKKTESAGARMVKTLLGVRSEAKRVDGTNATVQVKETGAKGVIGALTSVLVGAKKVDGTNASVKVGESGAARTISALMGVKSKAEDVDKQRVTLKTELKGAGEVTSGLEAIKNRSASLDRAKITLQTSLRGAAGVIGELGSLEGVASRIDGDKVLLTAKVDGTEKGRAAFASLEQAALKIDGDDIRMKAEVVGAANAVAELATVNSVADKIDGRNANVNFGATGATGVLAQTKAVDSAADRVDGRNVKLKFDASSLDILGRINAGLGETASRIRAFGVVGQTAAIPSIVAAIAGIVPVASAVGVAVTALAGGIGRGLAGAAAIGGGALGALYAGFGLVLAPVKLLTKRFEDYEKGVGTLTTAQKGLYDSFKRFKPLLDTAFLSAQDQVARLGTQILKLAESYLPVLGKASLGVMQGLTRAFAGFSGQLSGPVEQAGITRLLTMLPKLMETAARAAGTFGLALFNVFARSLKYVQPLMSAINGVAQRFLAFTESVAGQRSVDQWFATSAMRAKQLGAAVANLWRGFGGLFASLEQAGTTDRLMAEFVGLTRSFREFTAEGSRGRAAIVAFARAAQPILNATWALLKGLVGEWFRVSGALFRARTEAGKLIVPAALNGIRSALSVIGDLLINTFRRFGPLLGPLVAGIAGLLNAFIAHNPVLYALSRAVVGVLTAFRKLPIAMQSIIVSVASVASVLSVLGIGFATVATVGLGTLLPAIASLVAVAIGLGVAATVVKRNWGGIKSVFAPLAPVFQKVKSAMSSVVPVVKNLGAVIKGLLTGNIGTEAFKRSFASLPGPVQKAAKLIVIAWRGLQTSFAQAWARIKPILSQVASGIKTGLGTAFRFLVSQGKQLVASFEQNWPRIKATVLAVVKAVGSVVRTVLGGAFKFAVSQAKVVVDWFQRNWPLIKRTAETVFNAVKALVTNRLKTLFTIIKTVWGAAKAFWDTNSKEILAITKSVWNIIKTTISTFIKVVLGIIKATMQAITGDWRGAWNTIKGVVRTVWEAIKSNTKSVLSILGNIIKITWNNIKAITRAAWDAVYGYIKDKVTDAKDRAVLTLKIMGQGMFDRYEAMKRSAKAAWETIRDFIADPIERAAERVKTAIEAIKGIVGGVLEAFGQDNPFKEESPGGNGSGGRGSRPARVARFARGGAAREHRAGRFAKGGLGTSGRHPRTHMWNEQMGNEAYIAEREPSNTQMPYLKAAAGWHGMDVVPRRSSVPSHRGGPDGTEENPRAHKHARGGISGLPYRAFAYGGFGKEYFNSAASALDQAVMSRFPVDGSSYAGHPAGAVDFLVSSGNAQGQEKALGDSVAGWLDSNYNALNLRALIWYARARYEGGAWQPYVDNYGGGSGDVASQMHYNHPHAESLSGSFGKLNEDQTKGFTGGGGGGFGGMIKESLADQMWNGTQLEGWKGVVQSAVLGSVPLIGGLLKAGAASYPGLDKLLPSKLPDFGSGIVAGALGKKMGDYKGWVEEWIYEKFGGSSGPGGSTQDPGQGGSNRAIGERMLKASGVPGSFPSLDSLWTKESQWDENAQNPTSTAYGIPQFLDATWQQYGGKETEPTPQIDKGLQYIADRYGSTDDAWAHSQSVGWYSKGGMTNGPQRAVIGDTTELMLPLDDQRVMQSAQTALGTSELRAEVAQLREALVDKLDRVNLDTPSANHIVTGARNRAREVMKSTEGRGVIQTQNREIAKTQKLRRGR